MALQRGLQLPSPPWQRQFISYIVDIFLWMVVVVVLEQSMEEES